MGTRHILIADEHPVVRRGLRAIVADIVPFSLCEEADTLAGIVKAIHRQRRDLIVLGMGMPNGASFEGLSSIRRLVPDSKVLVFSDCSNGEDAVACFRAGACGYLSNTSSVADLAIAIQRTLAGQRYISAEVGELLASNLTSTTNALDSKLSEREWEIMLMLAAGRPSKDIASSLFISAKTVSTHRRRVLDKMYLTNNADLTRFALANHYIE